MPVIQRHREKEDLIKQSKWRGRGWGWQTLWQIDLLLALQAQADPPPTFPETEKTKEIIRNHKIPWNFLMSSTSPPCPLTQSFGLKPLNVHEYVFQHSCLATFYLCVFADLIDIPACHFTFTLAINPRRTGEWRRPQELSRRNYWLDDFWNLVKWCDHGSGKNPQHLGADSDQQWETEFFFFRAFSLFPIIFIDF